MEVLTFATGDGEAMSTGLKHFLKYGILVYYVDEFRKCSLSIILINFSTPSFTHDENLLIYIMEYATHLLVKKEVHKYLGKTLVC